MRIKYLALIGCMALLLHARLLLAFDLQKFEHAPPFSSTTLGQVSLEIAASDLARARILVAGREGFRVFEMSKADSKFQAQIDFADLALLRYHFQLETSDGKLYESAEYEIRQSSDKELEAEYKNLKKESSTLTAKISQLEANLFNLKQVKAQDLAKDKNAELGRALLLVGQKEKELAELKEQAQ